MGSPPLDSPWPGGYDEKVLSALVDDLVAKTIATQPIITEALPSFSLCDSPMPNLSPVGFPPVSLLSPLSHPSQSVVLFHVLSLQLVPCLCLLSSLVHPLMFHTHTPLMSTHHQMLSNCSSSVAPSSRSLSVTLSSCSLSGCHQGFDCARGL